MATRRQEDPPRLPSSPLMPEVGRDLASTLEKHFFLGLPFDEIARQLRVSARTVKTRLFNGQCVVAPGTLAQNTT